MHIFRLLRKFLVKLGNLMNKESYVKLSGYFTKHLCLNGEFEYQINYLAH